jgi:hypothetical protein
LYSSTADGRLEAVVAFKSRTYGFMSNVSADVKASGKRFLSTDAQDREIDILKKHERTGRPLGEDGFVETLETLLKRRLKRQEPGPRKKDK